MKIDQTQYPARVGEDKYTWLRLNCCILHKKYIVFLKQYECQ